MGFKEFIAERDSTNVAAAIIFIIICIGIGLTVYEKKTHKSMAPGIAMICLTVVVGSVFSAYTQRKITHPYE